METSLFDHFSSLRYHRREFPAQSLVFERDDPVDSLYWVETGEIHLLRRQEDGTAFVLQRAMAGCLLAEASLTSERYHCAAATVLPTRVAVFERKDINRLLAQNPAASAAFQAHLATEVRRARLRAEILSLRRVSQRLAAWLAWHDGKLPAKGRWQEIAQEIGVSPEALYREMARLRATGKIQT